MASTTTNDEAPAPAYDDHTHNEHFVPSNTSDAPPAYPIALPPTFRIGRHNPSPLVTVEELQAHLRILSAFDTLRLQVRGAVVESSGQTPDDAWFVYLARAVHRFDLWVTKIVQPLGNIPVIPDDMVPPLDVAMVWHSYSLVRMSDMASLPNTLLVSILI